MNATSVNLLNSVLTSVNIDQQNERLLTSCLHKAADWFHQLNTIGYRWRKVCIYEEAVNLKISKAHWNGLVLKEHLLYSNQRSHKYINQAVSTYYQRIP